MLIRIDLTRPILSAISAHISNRRELRKTEFVVTIQSPTEVMLSPSFRVRTSTGVHRATVDVLEHIMGQDIAEFREHMLAVNADSILFVAYPSKWKYCFNHRKCRRWERID